MREQHALKPPLLRERGWGEGTRRSSGVVVTARGSARTLIRPCGALSPP
ncbi:Hypothetical Protein XCAW_02959 [Xanthomonas citri subsp. citri Aw12879]|nr:Hypothetical Protein XCAW_02959 [Xanthomonas citri subsp. citri Aw12879]